MKTKDLTEEEIYEKYKHHLTFKVLEQFVEENKHTIDPNAKIIVERVEDKYFEKHGWKTLKVEGFQYGSFMKTNENIKAGLCEATEPIPQEFINETKEEFHPAWCISKKNSKIVLIYMHY